MYFHGNAEDVHMMEYHLGQLVERFNCSVLAMEYPGYGFFSHEIKNNKRVLKLLQCSASGITANAISTYIHVITP